MFDPRTSMKVWNHPPNHQISGKTSILWKLLFTIEIVYYTPINRIYWRVNVSCNSNVTAEDPLPHDWHILQQQSSLLSQLHQVNFTSSFWGSSKFTYIIFHFVGSSIHLLSHFLLSSNNLVYGQLDEILNSSSSALDPLVLDIIISESYWWCNLHR